MVLNLLCLRSEETVQNPRTILYKLITFHVAATKETIFWHVRLTKIQISLRSLIIQTVLPIAKDPKFLHVHNENSNQTVQICRLIWVVTGRTSENTFHILSNNSYYLTKTMLYSITMVYVKCHFIICVFHKISDCLFKAPIYRHKKEIL